MTPTKKKPRPKRCVWSRYSIITDCNVKRMAGMEFVYCPYCGKKIEVKK